jgi:hypothetical protein
LAVQFAVYWICCCAVYWICSLLSMGYAVDCLLNMQYIVRGISGAHSVGYLVSTNKFQIAKFQAIVGKKISTNNLYKRYFFKRKIKIYKTILEKKILFQTKPFFHSKPFWVQN